MDRREFLQSGSIAAVAGAAVTAAAPAAAETPANQARLPARDWSARAPKGEPVVKRFDEQRWVLDNVIQANGIDWDQSHTGGRDPLRRHRGRARHGGIAHAACGGWSISARPSRRWRENARAAANAAERNGDKILARDNYYLACQLLGFGDVDHR